MSLIKCKGCGKEISSFADSCPHCGKKVSPSAKYPQFYENSNSAPNSTYNTQNSHKSYDAPVTQEYSAPAAQPVKVEYKVACPKCGGTNISYQREQTASFGAGTNKVVIQKEKKSKGCLWWMCIGFWWVPMYWLLIGWWWRPIMGGRAKSGLNFNASKSVNRTMAVCQNCGHSWKVK